MRKTRLTRRDFLFGFRNRILSDPSPPSSLISGEAKKADERLKQGKYNEAVYLYQELIKQRPDNLVARQKLGYCYYKLGEIEKAKREFLMLKRMGVKSNFLALYLGLCFAHEGELQKAITFLKEFFDVTKPIIQRAINLQIAMCESNMLSREDMIKTIEEAIEEQNKMDSVS